MELSLKIAFEYISRNLLANVALLTIKLPNTDYVYIVMDLKVLIPYMIQCIN